MEPKELQMKNGSVLVSLTGYGGESDFYVLYDIMKEIVSPDEASYGVDSMCADGSFRRDGILVRMSSECVTDCCCFHYDAAHMTEEDAARVRGWIAEITEELHRRLPRP